MKKVIVVSLIIVFAFSSYCYGNKNSNMPIVKTGLEVLKASHFKQLEGKKIGLVTNPSGVDNNMVSIIDILHNAPNVNLVALFGPEHGVRGDMYAGAKVEDYNDPTTGLTVYSLYGKTRKATPEMLKGLDAVVYDIQDNGCRSFTFISSLGLLMEACAEQGVEVIILDRPNPLGGLKVEGNIVEPDYFSFVSQFEIPYIYGLTVGELATLLNEEGMLKGEKGKNEISPKCKLTVVPMKGWKRRMVYGDTKLQWVLPSPQIPQAETSYYYPASGILGEFINYMSIGVGYTLPFQIFAAEWIVNAEEFSKKLNELNLPGVKFRPIHLMPFYAVGAGKQLKGVQFYFTDYNKAVLTEVQFYVMQVVAEMYPEYAVFNYADSSRYRMFDQVTGSNYIRENFAKRHKFEDIKDYWHKDETKFKKLSKRYYLY
ncbi:MAG: DUF1343 domain-containing protein [Bacteroidales bacterium]|nr:DUF1343 domain-containing protein [Bacteroidales bacterium]